MRHIALFLLVFAACRAPELSPISGEPVSSGMTLGSQACLSGGLSWEVHNDAGALEAYVSRLVELGATQVRFPADWMAVEPEKGRYDTAFLERIVAALEVRGIRPIVQLGYGHTAYNGRTDGDRFYASFPPEPFAAYAGLLAKRFGTRIAAYEIWNEPNAGYRFFKPAEDPSAYAALTLAAADAIHAACADCNVLFGGVFWHRQVITGGVDFIRSAHASEPRLASALNGLAVHPYAFYPPMAAPDDDTAPEVPMLRMLSESAAAAGDSEIPIWLTEVGWPIQQRLGEETQAMHLVKSAVLAAKAGVKACCWYELIDGPRAGTFPPEHDFGLMHYAENISDATPKVAFASFQLLAKRLGGLHYARDRGPELGLAGPGQAALLFRDVEGKAAATILWNTFAARDSRVRVPLHRDAEVKLVGFRGDELPLNFDEGHSALVPVDDAPVVLVERVP